MFCALAGYYDSDDTKAASFNDVEISENDCFRSSVHLEIWETNSVSFTQLLAQNNNGTILEVLSGYTEIFDSDFTDNEQGIDLSLEGYMLIEDTQFVRHQENAISVSGSSGFDCKLCDFI